jgi:hypothetical protein
VVGACNQIKDAKKIFKVKQKIENKWGGTD